jgi:hypothetical protein
VRELSRKERTEFNKLQKRLRRNVGNAIADYSMIEDGVLVGRQGFLCDAGCIAGTAQERAD